MPAAHRPKPPAWLWPVITGAYILAWGAVNLGFLTRFPFVHSDEAWLAGLARNIWQSGSPAVTETFFDLKPRWPHGIKMAFHGLQILAIRLGGYNVFSVRVLSLLAGCAVLALFFVAARRLTGSGLAALGAVAALSLDVQFINAAHMARQEIFILLFMAACLAILCREGPLSTGHILLLAAFTGAAVWFHPNSFLAACLCGGALLGRWAFRQASLKQLALYVALTGALAGAVVAFCFWLDPQFPVHYMMYGQGEFDLLVPVTSKLGQLGGYFSRLWNQFSGTYYLPNIRVQLVLFCLAAVLAGFFALVMHREQPGPAAQALSLLAGAGGLLCGMVLIGRYSQTNIVFFFLPGWLLVLFCCRLFGEWAARLAPFALAGLMLALSVWQIAPWLNVRYADYLARIGQYVQPGSRVLGNLNAEFYFENGVFFDYRNLPYLAEHGLSVAGYIQKNNIEYILYYDELDLIWQSRPAYNALYGVPDDFYPQLKAFCAGQCTPVGSFFDPWYAVRIQAEQGRGEWGRVTVYRVN